MALKEMNFHDEWWRCCGLKGLRDGVGVDVGGFGRLTGDQFSADGRSARHFQVDTQFEQRKGEAHRGAEKHV